ncbi:hypothetical protein N7448_010428 [Penicillium atrosanguineum]|uniref:HXXEE domain-containing protein n=1 Tax=Penicillium atrosanguineum TaxID=1132637 RepID=A0A9W9GH12_9EURO|nr:Efflux pump dotC [Penicillium atrosanguineum]KAJ5118720.1 hypothetical protein N7526_010357 [Penicillium atrosanguineum]KAJ5119759.1 hypothetical protein N7448_010428 [Penicillium atrosanguineum]KAJ5296759.1 Efflux pump dotC [Penicillium atrosanguineum]KAJ5299519.1 hypothetical protein N7476_011076 [Penicillium atrosanguineum]
MMDLIIYHWYDLGIISGIIMIRYYRANYRTLQTSQKLLIANFLALIFHQFEEYRFPGGFPAIMNIAVQSSDAPDRYPLNAYSGMITNVIATYGLYLPVIFFPDVVWLGLTSVLFGFAQVWIHGIMINIKLGSIYNPGLTAVVLGFVPIGLKYIRHMQEIGMLTTRDWIFATLGAVAFGYGLLIKSTFGWLPDYETLYPFTQAEMQRWGARLAGMV